jgi:hypothetical protein
MRSYTDAARRMGISSTRLTRKSDAPVVLRHRPYAPHVAVTCTRTDPPAFPPGTTRPQVHAIDPRFSSFRGLVADRVPTLCTRAACADGSPVLPRPFLSSLSPLNRADTPHRRFGKKRASYASLVAVMSAENPADFRGLEDACDEPFETFIAADLGLCVEVSGLEPPTSTLRT